MDNHGNNNNNAKKVLAASLVFDAAATAGATAASNESDDASKTGAAGISLDSFLSDSTTSAILTSSYEAGRGQQVIPPLLRTGFDPLSHATSSAGSGADFALRLAKAWTLVGLVWRMSQLAAWHDFRFAPSLTAAYALLRFFLTQSGHCVRYYLSLVSSGSANVRDHVAALLSNGVRDPQERTLLAVADHTFLDTLGEATTQTASAPSPFSCSEAMQSCASRACAAMMAFSGTPTRSAAFGRPRIDAVDADLKTLLNLEEETLREAHDSPDAVVTIDDLADDNAAFVTWCTCRYDDALGLDRDLLQVLGGGATSTEEYTPLDFVLSSGNASLCRCLACRSIRLGSLVSNLFDATVPDPYTEVYLDARALLFAHWPQLTGTVFTTQSA